MGRPSSADDLRDRDLFREYALTRQRSTRNHLVERHLGLAIHISRRFHGSYSSRDDLQQVATLGLVKAIERFDPDHGASFATFAGTTIEGELKRHLRDHGWMVRVPRSAKDLNVTVRRATDELAQRLGRSPSVDEVAEHLGLDSDDVVRGIAAAQASSVESLNAGSAGAVRDPGLRIADQEEGYGGVEDTNVVESLLLRLPEREREIVRLRFYDQLSQAEIAARMDISQMHVSRLLRSSFSQMRTWLTEEFPESGSSFPETFSV
jgi:RNA polymerase sigma-B factor